jgi:hypothetical protein
MLRRVSCFILMFSGFFLLTAGCATSGRQGSPKKQQEDRPDSPQAAGPSDPETVTLLAREFIEIDLSGFLPFYQDKKRDCLAIDAAKHKSGVAAAQFRFNGKAGRYRLTLTALTEIDGESTYRIFIDGRLVAETQNPPVDEARDNVAHDHDFPPVEVASGSLIQVQANPHSNGKIPEGDGFAFARGRWRALTLRSVSDDG